MNKFNSHVQDLRDFCSNICSFNLDDTCEDLKNTESVNFTCVDFADDLYKSCTPECKDPNFVFLNAVPRKINCGPLGVFDPYNPTSTFQISECGSKKYIYIICIIYKYIIVV